MPRHTTTCFLAAAIILLGFISGCQQRTPMHERLQYAIIWSPDRVPGMLANGMDPNKREIFESTSPLELAVTHHTDEGSGYTKSQMVMDLLEHGADPKLLPKAEQARLMQHVMHEFNGKLSTEAVIALLDHGLDPNGLTPNTAPLFQLDWTLHKKSAEEVRQVAEAIIRHGADLSPRSQNGSTPLHYAVESAGHFKHDHSRALAKTLIAAGADLSAVNDRQDTPLHIAIGPHDLEMIQLLVDAGAPLDIPNTRGHTPMQLITLTPALRDTIRLPERVGRN